MSESPNKRKLGWGTISVAAVLALVLYSFSIGPAAWLVGKIDGERRTAGRIHTQIYRPLTVAAKVAGLDWELKEYMSWFLDPPEALPPGPPMGNRNHYGF